LEIAESKERRAKSKEQRAESKKCIFGLKGSKKSIWKE